AELVGGIDNLGFTLFSRNVETVFPPLRALQQKLDAHCALADSSASGNERDAAFQESSADKVIQAGHTGTQPLRHFNRWRGVAAGGISYIAREYCDAALFDREIMPSLEMCGVPEFIDFNVPLPIQSFFNRCE